MADNLVVEKAARSAKFAAVLKAERMVVLMAESTDEHSVDN
jgi:hypothetical protein